MPAATRRLQHNGVSQVGSSGEEATRQLSVCNACRYCEGYCAVFPALTDVVALDDLSVAYLGHLCHDCGACVQACMYSEPHPFRIDIRRLLQEERVRTYERYTTPEFARRAFERPVRAFVLTVALVVALATVGVAETSRWHQLTTRLQGAGAFYKVVPYGVMLGVALGISFLAAWLVAAKARRFWADIRTAVREGIGRPSGARAIARVAWEALVLRWQTGGGDGCYALDNDRPSGMRRCLHVSLVFGFGLAFAATIAAAIEQDLAGIEPPYPLLSVPVVLGLIGGILMMAGAAGLLILRVAADPAVSVAPMRKLDYTFIFSLILVALTGILLLALRNEPGMGVLLLVHLVSVGVFFLLIPYSKMLHSVFRLLALCRFGLNTPSPDQENRRSTSRGSDAPGIAELGDAK